MTNSELVEITYLKHHQWLLAVSFNFTQSKLEAEELVQELYLKLLELKDIDKIRYKDQLNMFYSYKMLRSIFINKTKKHIYTVEIDNDLIETLESEEYDYEADAEWEKKLLQTNNILDEAKWFDAVLLRTYINENHSIRSLSEATKISMSTIWSSLSKTKKHAKNKYSEKNMSTDIQNSSVLAPK